MSKVTIYSNGIVHCSVCVHDAEMSRKEIEAEVNRQNPSGISLWTISSEKCFADGSSNPKPCECEPERLHYLMVC